MITNCIQQLQSEKTRRKSVLRVKGNVPFWKKKKKKWSLILEIEQKLRS